MAFLSVADAVDKELSLQNAAHVIGAFPARNAGTILRLSISAGVGCVCSRGRGPLLIGAARGHRHLLSLGGAFLVFASCSQRRHGPDICSIGAGVASHPSLVDGLWHLLRTISPRVVPVSQLVWAPP